MDRRTALQTTAFLLGGTIVGAEAILSGCVPQTKQKKSGLFKEGDEALLTEIADTILPDTPDSPGAKQAGVGAFMMLIVEDCYETREQKLVLEGLQKIQTAAKQANQGDFVVLNAVQRHDLLANLDQEARQYESSKTDDEPSHYFTLLKQLSVFAYFSSEVGTTKALRYNPIPGRFDGCVDYKKGEKAWA